MNLSALLPTVANRRQTLSAFAYLTVVLGGLGCVYAMVATLFANESRVASLRERAAQLESRADARGGAAAGGAEPSGSPFFEGQTIALAGAALQQRIEQAASQSGGALLSSQIDLDGAQPENRVLTLAVSLEFAQSALQSFLYNIEAGRPYLFVDLLEVRVAEAVGEVGDGRMRVTMNVSGQWEPTQ